MSGQVDTSHSFFFLLSAQKAEKILDPVLNSKRRAPAYVEKTGARTGQMLGVGGWKVWVGVGVWKGVGGAGGVEGCGGCGGCE